MCIVDMYNLYWFNNDADVRIEIIQDLEDMKHKNISMWEVNKLSRGFYDVCNSIRWRSVNSPQGTKNSDTYPFEALPHYHSSSIYQNYFAVSISRLSLNALHATLVLTVICNKLSFFFEHPPYDMQ